MTKEQLLDRVPPCGLMCYTCPGFEDGAIAEHSAALLRLNEGFREFLDIKLSEEYRYLLEEYDKFIEKLKRDANPKCPGCRKINGEGPGCIEGCFIPECVKEHGVDFCAECDKFPCSKVRDSEIYGKEAREAIVEGSLLIKENGAERFFEIKKDASHYAKYKKTT